jgi:hypothetical protein
LNVMQFVPISYQPDPSPSDSSLDSSHNSREQQTSTSIRRSKLPLSPKSSIRSRRQSQICGVPLLETQLIPSLRDTIDRMTRLPTRVVSAAVPPTPPPRERSCDSLNKSNSSAASKPLSPTFQCNSSFSPNDHGPTQNVETVVLQPKSAPLNLKSALRSPKTPKTVASPSQGSPALRSVKSILCKKVKSPPCSKNQGISSKVRFWFLVST